MRIWARLTLIFLLLTWTPLGAAVWLLTEQVEATFEQSYAERRNAVERAVRRRFEQLATEVGAALDRVAEDPLLAHELLEPLARGRFYGDQQRERTIVREAERLMTSPALDTLRLVDLEEGGRVVAMGHRRGVEPPDREALRWAREFPGTPLLRHERVENRQTGTADAVWTLQVLRVAGERVALIGGEVLDERLLQELLVGSAGGAGGDVAVVLDDGQGKRVAATFDGEAPEPVAGGYDVASIELENPEEPGPAAALRLFVSRAGLARVVADLWRTAFLLAGGSGLAALLVGIWLSRRFSRPLEKLAAAALDVAGGARDVTVPELGGRDEVASLTRTFNAMTRDLRESEERLRQSERVAAWREIARRIAHEIKNPLFPIQTSIETLRKARQRQHPEFEEIFAESTATILEEVARMKRIVTEFSNFARMPAPRPAPTDLVELARHVLSLHEAAAGEVDLSLSGDAELVVEADGDQLTQALTNVVQNAIEAGQGGGRIELRVAAAGEGSAAIVTVKDDGPGMDQETLDKLFTPYFTTKATGTGLGLAIVHRIVEEHGGRIQVESEPGSGTTFTITLPAARARA